MNTNSSEILLKVIDRIYEQNPDMQHIIGSLLVDVGTEETFWIFS